jgi:predicted phage terminase large subunit-like protein
VQTTYHLPPRDLAVEALYDCWAFFELIKYRGGVSAWDQVHYDFLLCLQAPQLYHAGRLVGDTLKRWQYCQQYDKEATVPHQNRLLKLPRGHYKSSIVMGYAKWRIYRNPNIRILHSTNVLDLSQSFVRELRSYFEDEELQATVWNVRPHIRGRLIPVLDASRRRSMQTEASDTKVVWNNEDIQVVRSLKAKEATFSSTSVGARKTGHHYDLVLMDDVVDYDNSSSEVKIKKMLRWTADVVSIVNKGVVEDRAGVLPDGTVFIDRLGDERIATGTHYDPKDYYASTEAKAKVGKLPYNVFERNIYTNGLDNADGYILRNFTAKDEAELREELAEQPGVFDAQYLNKIMSEELQTLSTSKFKWLPEAVLLEGRIGDYVYFNVGGVSDSPDYVRPIISVDPAISLKSRADDTAIIVGGKSHNDKLVILEAHAGHFTPERTCDLIAELVKKWGVSTVHLEAVGFQVLLRKMVIKHLADAKLRCGVIDYMPKGNKAKRIEYHLHSYSAAGNVIAASHLKHNQRFVNPIDFFGKATSRDDVPDALAVIAEKSFPAEDGGNRTSLRRHDRFWLTQHPDFNPQYGGIY